LLDVGVGDHTQHPGTHVFTIVLHVERMRENKQRKILKIVLKRVDGLQKDTECG